MELRADPWPPDGKWRDLVLPAVILAVGVLALSWHLVVFGPRLRAEAREDVRAVLVPGLDLRAEAIEAWLDGRTDELRILANLAAVSGPGPALASTVATLGASREFSWVGVANRDGLIVAQTGPGGRLTAPAEAALALPHPDQPTVGLHGEEGAAEVLLAVPAAGARPYVAVGVAPTSRWLHQLAARPVAHLRSGEMIVLAAAGDTGRAVVPTRLGGGRRFAVALADTGVAGAAALAGRAGFREYRDYRGEAVLAATRRLVGAPWGLVLKVDRAEVYRPVDRRLLGEAVSIAAGFLLLAALAWSLARSHRSRVEAGRVAGRAEFARLMDEAGDAIVAVDQRGTILHANRRALAMVGESLGAVRGRPLSGVSAQGSWAGAVDALPTLQRTGEARFEIEHVLPSGLPTPFEVSVRAVRLDGAMPAYVAVARDITERRRAQQRIAALVTLLRVRSEISRLTALEHSADGLMTGVCRVAVQVGRLGLGVVYRVLDNGCLEAMTWAGAGLGHEARARIDPAQADLPAMRAAREGGVVVPNRIPDPPARPGGHDAAPRFRSEAAVPVAGDGAVRHVLALYHREAGFFIPEVTSVLQDIAADLSTALRNVQVRAEREAGLVRLRDSEERYRRIVETSLEGIVQFDADWRVVFANPRAGDMAGVPVEQLLGRHLMEFVGPDQRAEMVRLMARRESGVAEVHEFRLGAGVASNRELIVSTNPLLDEKGRFVGAVAMLSDVTERRRLESELHAMVTAAPIGIALTDRDGRLTFVNSSCERIFGFTAAESLGRLPPYLQPHEEPGYLAGVRRALGGEVVHYDATRTVAGGRSVDLQVIMAPLRMGESPAYGVVVLLTEMTEQRVVREALVASEARFRRLIESAGVGIALTARDGCILTANPALGTLLGLPPGDLVGRAAREFVHPEDTGPGPEVLQELAGKSEVGHHQVARLRRADGAAIWVSIHVNPLPGAPEEEPILVSILEDVTHRVEAEAARERLERAVNQSHSVVVMTDVDGTIVYANARLTELTGYTPEEVLGQNPRVLQSGRTPPSVYQELWTTVLRGETWVGELLNRKKDGALFWEQATISPVRDTTGRITHIVAVKEDITARKAAERELEARVRLVKSLELATTRDRFLTVALGELTSLFEADGACFVSAGPKGFLTVTHAGGEWQKGAGSGCGPGDPAEELHQAGVPGATGRVPAGLERLTTDREWQALGIPAWRQGAVWGSFWVGRRRHGLAPHPFDAWDVSLAAALEPMLEDMLVRVDLQEQTERRLRRLQAMKSIDAAIAASLDLGLTLQVILEHVAAQLEADACDILLTSPDGLRLEPAADHGLLAESLPASVPAGEGTPGVAVRDRTTVTTELTGRGSDPRAAALFRDGYRAHVAAPLISGNRIVGALELFLRRRATDDPEWHSYLDALAEQAAIAIDKARLVDDLQRSHEELARSYDATIEGWVRALDLRDQETEGHTQRVTDLAVRLARRLGFSEDEVVQIRRGGLLHDIGKVGVPDAILRKPGALSPEERAIMERHPGHAYEMLKPIPYLRPALDIPWCHHEHWDGSGYPRGLRGDAIPAAARLFAIVDKWDALTSDRVYRKAWSREKVIAWLREAAGKELDPGMVETFIGMVTGDSPAG